MKASSLQSYLERLGNLLRAQARESGAEQGLQPVHIEALHYLSVCNRYSNVPLAVAEYLGLTKGTVSQTLTLLSKKGLLEKQADLKDKRVTHLTLTPEGEAVLQRAVPATALIRACEEISEERQAELVSGLQHLLETAQRINGRKTFAVCRSCRYHQKRDEGLWCGLVDEALEESAVEQICREHDYPGN